MFFWTMRVIITPRSCKSGWRSPGAASRCISSRLTARMNLIERLWGLMHKHLTHNKTYATYREFAEVTLDFLTHKVPNCWPEVCESVADNFRVINPKDFRVLV
jgi:hypothetical protein